MANMALVVVFLGVSIRFDKFSYKCNRRGGVGGKKNISEKHCLLFISFIIQQVGGGSQKE